MYFLVLCDLLQYANFAEQMSNSYFGFYYYWSHYSLVLNFLRDREFSSCNRFSCFITISLRTARILRLKRLKFALLIRYGASFWEDFSFSQKFVNSFTSRWRSIWPYKHRWKAALLPANTLLNLFQPFLLWHRTGVLNFLGHLISFLIQYIELAVTTRKGWNISCPTPT